jgi:hypothetical protein
MNSSIKESIANTEEKIETLKPVVLVCGHINFVSNLLIQNRVSYLEVA